MTAADIPDPQQCRVQPRAAVTLRPTAAARLTVIEGRAWITFDGPHGGLPQCSGDLVLTASSPPLEIAAGQRVVVEAYDAAPVLVRTAAVPTAARRRWFGVRGTAAPAGVCRPSVVSYET